MCLTTEFFNRIAQAGPGKGKPGIFRFLFIVPLTLLLRPSQFHNSVPRFIPQAYFLHYKHITFVITAPGPYFSSIT